MVKRLIWTEKALLTRKEILEYWNEATGNKDYSVKLDSKIEEITNLLLLFPELGKRISNFDGRFILEGDYSVVYKIEKGDTYWDVKILQVWDTRRDPDKLKI